MNLVEVILDTPSRCQYNKEPISTRTMYDDYDLDYAYSNEFYAHDLDEIVECHMQQSARDVQFDSYQTLMTDVEDQDEYARDSCDYNDLAYRHYA